LVSGKLDGRQVYFLPRHGRGHRILPTELNHRANIFALRSLNVRWIISIGAVGSLQEKYAPREIVLPSQFFDRTSRRSDATFFGEGIVAHVGFADPVSKNLRDIIARETAALGYKVHNGGTYVNMDGPAFSTRAESELHRRLGFDVIGMTNLPEAKLAREAEISLASVNFVTDYDCWKIEDHRTNTVRTSLARTSSTRFRTSHRSQALAPSNGHQTRDNSKKIFVTLCVSELRLYSFV
jgi:5'-methylthioadenosine phosphorylase